MYGSGKKEAVIIFLVLFLLMFLAIAAIKSIDAKGVEEYNDGYCIKCGEKYSMKEHYEKADGTYITHFYCTNPHCGFEGTVSTNLIKN